MLLFVNSVPVGKCALIQYLEVSLSRTLSTVPPKDGNIAELTVADNYIGTVISKGDKVLKEYSTPLEEGVTSRYLWGSYERLQKQAKSGFDFFGEFCKAILK